MEEPNWQKHRIWLHDKAQLTLILNDTILLGHTIWQQYFTVEVEGDNLYALTDCI